MNNGHVLYNSVQILNYCLLLTDLQTSNMLVDLIITRESAKLPNSVAVTVILNFCLAEHLYSRYFQVFLTPDVKQNLFFGQSDHQKSASAPKSS